MELKQLQSGDDVPYAFKMPMWVKFYGADDQVHYDSVYIRERVDDFSFTLPFMPDSVELDTIKVLCRVNPPNVSVREFKGIVASESKVFPNPVTASQEGKINLVLNKAGNIKLEIYDDMGRYVKNSYSGYLNNGQYEFSLGTQFLASGNYYVKISNGVEYSFIKFTKIR